MSHLRLLGVQSAQNICFRPLFPPSMMSQEDRVTCWRFWGKVRGWTAQGLRRGEFCGREKFKGTQKFRDEDTGDVNRSLRPKAIFFFFLVCFKVYFVDYISNSFKIRVFKKNTKKKKSHSWVYI